MRARGRAFEARTVRIVRAAVCAVVAGAVCVTLAGCEPTGRAVGDTQDKTPSVAHVGVLRGDAVIGVIGSRDVERDKTVMNGLADGGITAAYVSVSDAADDADLDAQARQGVVDMTARVVTLIVVIGIDVSRDARGWDDALRGAREAGIPVALVDPVHAPSDALLYAATLTVDDDAEGAMGIDDAAATIFNDEPHSRAIVVTTRVTPVPTAQW